MSAEQHFDLIIAGGGPVGATLACAMAGASLRTAVLESAPESSQSDDPRGLALSLATKYILRSCGVWDELRATPIRQIHISTQGRLGTVRLNATDLGEQALGYVVAADRLRAALWKRLHDLPGLKLLRPARADSLQIRKHSVQACVQTQGQELQLHARLLVAADGADSPSCKQAGLQTRCRDYAQSAVLSHCQPERGHAYTAYERFTAQGLLAVLPLDAERCKLVCIVPSRQAEQLLQMPEQTFLDWVEQELGGRLGRLHQLGPRACYPLRSQRSTALPQQRILPLGDAAHSIHPNAAQGLNLGLRDAAMLAEILAEHPSDPGASALLQSYHRRRRHDHLRTFGLSEGLACLCRYSHMPPVAWTRGAGMTLIDLLPSLKHRLLLIASGLWGLQARTVSEGVAG